MTLEAIPLVSSNHYSIDLKLSDIATQISYIPLETKDNCLIGNWFSVFCSNEFIFVENSGIILQFTSKGKFIRQINTDGQGPGEGSARDFTIDEENQLIYIYHNFSLNVLVFNMDGKYIKTIRNPFTNEKGVHGAMTLSFYNGNLLFPFTVNSGQASYKYAVISESGKIIHKETNYTKYFLKERILESSISLTSPFYFYNSSCFFKQEYNDTIFRINHDFSCIPIYISKLEKQITLEDVMKVGAHLIPYSSLSGKNKINGVAESEMYLDIYHSNSFYDEDNFKYFFSRYNKKTQQILPNLNPEIINDWDGGVDISMTFPYFNNSVMCIKLQPFEIKEKLTNAHFLKTQAKYPEQKDTLQKLVNSLKEDDNPVLMLIHLK